MWMSPPTPVTISSISKLSASMRRAMSTCRSPTCSHGRRVDVTGPELLKTPKRTMLKTNERTTAVMESWPLRRGLRCVNSVMTAAETNGSNNTIHARFVSAMLELHESEVFDVGRLSLAIERDDEGKADRNFGGSDGDDKEDHDLPAEVICESREGDERKICGVQHQFERHVDDQQIAPDDDTEEPEAEEQRADDEVVFEANHAREWPITNAQGPRNRKVPSSKFHSELFTLQPFELRNRNCDLPLRLMHLIGLPGALNLEPGAFI